MRTFNQAQRSAKKALPALLLLLAWGGLALNQAQAHSADLFATQAVKKSKRPKPDKGNGETTPEREKRLLRECKGRPNAGACEGYAG